jgi:hypothetical protein
MAKSIPDLLHSSTSIMISILNPRIRHDLVNTGGDKHLLYDCRDMTMSLL